MQGRLQCLCTGCDGIQCRTGTADIRTLQRFHHGIHACCQRFQAGLHFCRAVYQLGRISIFPQCLPQLVESIYQLLCTAGQILAIAIQGIQTTGQAGCAIFHIRCTGFQLICTGIHGFRTVCHRIGTVCQLSGTICQLSCAQRQGTHTGCQLRCAIVQQTGAGCGINDAVMERHITGGQLAQLFIQ